MTDKPFHLSTPLSSKNTLALLATLEQEDLTLTQFGNNAIWTYAELTRMMRSDTELLVRETNGTTYKVTFVGRGDTFRLCLEHQKPS